MSRQTIIECSPARYLQIALTSNTYTFICKFRRLNLVTTVVTRQTFIWNKLAYYVSGTFNSNKQNDYK